MAKYSTLNALFTAIANSLRGKTGSTGKIVADDFPSVIDSLSTGGITPAGTKIIKQNGSFDVTSFATAQVEVPVGVTPQGTKPITSNGLYDVSTFANAQVDVPIPSGYIKPSGSINITENKSVNVSQYETAVVNVPVPEQISVVRTVTISADVTGANATTTLLAGDAFIKAHYADAGFSAMWFLVTPVASATGVIHFNYQGNRNIGSSNVARTGVGLKSTSASAMGLVGMTTAINGKGYAQHMRVDSSGNLLQYLASGLTLKAGTYQIILTCTT